MSEVRTEETDRGPALDNGLVRVEVHLNKGTFSVIEVGTGKAILEDAAASVALVDGPTFTTRGEGIDLTGTSEVGDSHGDGTSLLLVRETYEDEPELHLSITIYPDQPFVMVQAEIQNTCPAPIQVRELRPLDGARLVTGAALGDLRFYNHGWQSWSPSFVLSCADAAVPMSPPVLGPGTQPQPKAGRFISDLVTAVAESKSGHGVVAGFVSAAHQFSHVYLDTETRTLTAVSHADGITLSPKGILESEKLYIQAGDATEALCRYGDALSRGMEARPHNRVPSGWCSWYYYWQGVSEAEVLANLDDLAEHPLPIDYVQIDDGYQSDIGDWLTVNDKFPNGMKWLADRIHERGFKAGIWVAPFIATAGSRLFQEHRDWFVKFSTGHPAIATMNWGQLCFALDTTHPEVIDWLLRLFRTICDDWGYDYVKIDFIFAAAVDGVRHDADWTRAQAYRRGVETIREAVGDRFILACGNPVGPSVGLVDGARIGPDVAPYWRPVARDAPRDPMSDPSVLNSIRNAIARFWMHDRIWLNDPDCLLVRETDTAMTEDEVRCLATVIGMTGGMVLDSDNLLKLSPKRRLILASLLPVYGKSAVPLDFFSAGGVAQILLLDCGTHRLLALFNWSDELADVLAALPDGRWHAFEFWAARYLGAFEGTLPLNIPPHGCLLVRLTPDLGRPQVVGSTMHMMMGAMEIADEVWDGARLRIALEPVANRDGALHIWRPDGIVALAVESLTAPRTLEV